MSLIDIRIKCPECGFEFQKGMRLTQSEEKNIQDGDLSICGSCACFLVYRDGVLTTLPSEQFNQLPTGAKLSLFRLRLKVMEGIADRKTKMN